MEETYLESDVETTINEGAWSLKKDVITFNSGDYQFEYKLISPQQIRWAPEGEEYNRHRS
ncbi:MAG: hypothetical protein U5N58_13190 [Actinomycetota bacterium]|nr:hypothetical protein [Actinomycetota bacterium]